jgi:hypothetical protein
MPARTDAIHPCADHGVGQPGSRRWRGESFAGFCSFSSNGFARFGQGEGEETKKNVQTRGGLNKE